MSRPFVIALAGVWPLTAAAEVKSVPLKLSGYVQAQYVRNAASDEGLKKDGTPENLDEFEVRRARIKLQYDDGLAIGLLQADFTSLDVRLLDAYAGANVTLGGVKAALFGGLFRIPFGYELQASMADFPFPERSILADREFPGVRDVGARADLRAFDDALQLQLAVVNGNPIGDATFPGDDPNAAKDFVGRLGTKLGGFTAGVSGYSGTGWLPPTSGGDGKNYGRHAIGADAEAELGDPLGKLRLLGEVTLSRSLDRKKAANLPQVDAEGHVRGKDELGYYVGFQQYLGDVFSLGARFQQFDPDRDESDDTLTAVTFVGHAEPTKSMRLTLAYEIRREHPSVDDDQLWVRAQVKY
jgi:hypothetical protein